MKKQKNLLMLPALVSLNNNHSQQRGVDTPSTEEHKHYEHTIHKNALYLPGKSYV